MGYLKQKINFLISMLIGFIILSASCQQRKVTVVINNLQNDICLLRINSSAEKINDTIYLSNENIGIIDCADSEDMRRILLKFVYFNVTGDLIEIEEYSSVKNYNEVSKYYQHGMFTGLNDDSFLLILIGDKKYLDSLNENFDVDSPFFENKLKKGVEFEL